MTVTTLKYTCPHCKTLIEATEGVLGEVVECPNELCQKPFRLEVPSAEPATKREVLRNGPPEARIEDPADDEETIQVVHPAMFRNHPLQFLLLAAMLLVGVAGAVGAIVWETGLNVNGEELLTPYMTAIISGVLALIALGFFGAWWIRVIMTTLTVTSERTQLRKGIIARETSEVRHADVRNLQVDQNVVQRILGVGDLAISSSGQDDLEIVIKAIPDPQGVIATIKSRQ